MAAVANWRFAEGSFGVFPSNPAALAFVECGLKGAGVGLDARKAIRLGSMGPLVCYRGMGIEVTDTATFQALRDRSPFEGRMRTIVMRLGWKWALAVWLNCAATGIVSSQHGPFGHYTGPNSLGTYRHDRAITVKSFLAYFGAVPSRRDTYCIADADHRMFLHASVDPEHDRKHLDMVFLSSFPNCKHIPVLAAPIDPEIWKTPEGIGIGSTKQAVLKVYGQPQYSTTEVLKPGSDEIAGMRDSDHIQIDLGDSSYLYTCMIDKKQGCDDLRATQFGFKQGKVTWISISDSE